MLFKARLELKLSAQLHGDPGSWQRSREKKSLLVGEQLVAVTEMMLTTLMITHSARSSSLLGNHINSQKNSARLV